MIPTFAVVGRSNKGKSSIVATLTENDQIAIAPTPRTTQRCDPFTMTVRRQSLFKIIDTPGFEEAPAMLEWLHLRPVQANQRRDRMIEFLSTFKGTDQFRYERELLEPILAGAAILYVADASHPYRPNYESEFEILRWTGQPSMALINQIGEGNHIEDWRAALNQYFRKVKVFNAHQSKFQDRITLLEEMRVIHDDLKPSLDLAISALQDQHRERLRASAAILAEFIIESIHYQLSLPVKQHELQDHEKIDFVHRFHDQLRQMEQDTRQRITHLFNYRSLETFESDLEKPVYEKDLFSRETWEIFGLTRPKLIIAGAAAGAIAGGSVDAMVGGASLAIGTGIGALLGGTSSIYLAFSDPKIAGIKISRSRYMIGPNQNPNFPWILLDRGVAFVEALLRRTHAQRSALHVDQNEGKKGLSAQLSGSELRALGWLFRKSKWKLQRDKVVRDLTLKIESLISSALSS